MEGEESITLPESQPEGGRGQVREREREREILRYLTDGRSRRRR